MDIVKADFQAKVVDNNKVTVVDFWAPWCGYCVRMAPVFESLAEKMANVADFYKVNTDEEGALAGDYKIEVLPTFAIFKNGEIVNKLIGYVPESELRAAIEEHL